MSRDKGAPLVVIGGGLAGCEAAFHAAERGIKVFLYEMRPKVQTPAHQTGNLAELVCSNSLRSADPLNPSGLLKEEMRMLRSLVLWAADATRLPAGSALAVDREKFSAMMSERIAGHARIEVVREEAHEVPKNVTTVVATGPLTSDRLAEEIRKITVSDHLYFYDAISPIVDADTINFDRVFKASRYDKGGADYVNCPMTKAEYEVFYDEMMKAEKVPAREFEKIPYFEGCMPLEVMAERGKETLLFGPMRPVGLVDPRTGKIPHAVVQLRQEDLYATCYNIVGFQTKLKWPEQKRVFRIIPGLERAEFLRYGSLHRNTYVNAPMCLAETLQIRKDQRIFFAGQITGVEGYVESAATGILAGINAARILSGEDPVVPPATTAHGSLIAYITRSSPKNFQPMNINFGIFPSLGRRVKERETRHRMTVERARKDLSAWIDQFKIF